MKEKKRERKGEAVDGIRIMERRPRRERRKEGRKEGREGGMRDGIRRMRLNEVSIALRKEGIE